ncbi:MAG: transposase [Gammaproteobacteria bacterium]
MPNYRRVRMPGGCFFFTVVIRGRKPILVDNISLLRNAFRKIIKRYPFHIDGIVVLPDHMHCIWTLPPDDDDYISRWRLIKSEFTRHFPFSETVSASRMRKDERGIWQRRFWEHLIRDEHDYRRHMDYIHYNPVKHGYVNRPAEWPYSSFRQCVKRGTYDEGWAEPVDKDMDCE